MAEGLIWTFRAIDQLLQLSKQDPRQARRVLEAIVALANERRGDIKKLRGTDEWRLRVGDWRVIFLQGEDERPITVVRIVIRRDAYDD